MPAMDPTIEDINALNIRLAELRLEHRDLDEAIATLIGDPSRDELMLRRLKKRKLLLKDQIVFLERQLDSDDLA